MSVHKQLQLNNKILHLISHQHKENTHKRACKYIIFASIFELSYNTITIGIKNTLPIDGDIFYKNDFIFFSD